MKFILFLGAVAVFTWMGGCGDARTQQACRMKKESVLAVGQQAPSGVAVAAVDDNVLCVAWTADAETWVAFVDPAGALLQEPRVISRRSMGVPTIADEKDGTPKLFWPTAQGASFRGEDVSLAGISPGSVAVGILERSGNGRPGGAFVALVSPGDMGSIPVMRIGDAGPFADGISLAAVGEQLLIAWHEGGGDTSDVWLAHLSVDPLMVLEKRKIEDPVAAGPSLAVLGGKPFLAWTRIAQRGETTGREVKVARVLSDGTLDQGVPVAFVTYLDPAPNLIATGDGLGLAFRDDEDHDDVPEFFFSRLGSSGQVLGGPTRISRADGFRGPSLSFGGPFVFSAQIRSFQRNLLVGMNRFDLEGIRQGGEYQVYADKSDFVRVAVYARADAALLVYGEDGQGRGRIIAGQVDCAGK